MVFKKKGNEVMGGRLNLRCPLDEEIQIREDAALAGLSVSEMVRVRYFGRKIVANTDIIMIKELRRIGGLLKHIHNQSDGTYSQQTAEALVTVKTYIEKLSNDR